MSLSFEKTKIKLSIISHSISDEVLIKLNLVCIELGVRLVRFLVGCLCFMEATGTVLESRNKRVDEAGCG